eukprot:2292814-Pyramimonas_sp.AAC.1
MAAAMARMVRVGWGRAPSATSIWLEFQLEPRRDQHPEIFAVAEPLYTWAQMVAASSVPREVLRQTFVQQQQALGNDPKSAAASGSAGA